MNWKATKGGLIGLGLVTLDDIGGSTTLTLNTSNTDLNLLGRFWGTATKRIFAYPRDGSANGFNAIWAQTTVTWKTNGIERTGLKDVPLMSLVPVSDGDVSMRGMPFRIPVFPGDSTELVVTWPANSLTGQTLDMLFFVECVPG